MKKILLATIFVLVPSAAFADPEADRERDDLLDRAEREDIDNREYIDRQNEIDDREAAREAERDAQEGAVPE